MTSVKKNLFAISYAFKTESVNLFDIPTFLK